MDRLNRTGCMCFVINMDSCVPVYLLFIYSDDGDLLLLLVFNCLAWRSLWFAFVYFNSNSFAYESLNHHLENWLYLFLIHLSPQWNKSHNYQNWINNYRLRLCVCVSHSHTGWPNTCKVMQFFLLLSRNCWIMFEHFVAGCFLCFVYKAMDILFCCVPIFTHTFDFICPFFFRQTPGTSTTLENYLE